MDKLPEGWKITPLIACCGEKPKYGANSPSIPYDPALPRYIRITDITDNGRLANSGIVSVPLEGNEQYVLEEGDFLFARSGATVGKSYLYKDSDGWAIYAGYLIKFRANEDILLVDYLRQFCQSPRYQTWVKNTIRAGAQPNINATEYSSLPIPLPPLAEQRKIAAILGTWDAAIATVEQLITALKTRQQGLMQRLLTGAVRFPEFEGSEWEQKRFGEVFERVTRKNTVNNTNVLTASAQHGLVSQVEYFNRSVAGADLSNYYLLKKGEFAYNRSSSDGYPFGAIKQLEEYEEGILSTLYICFRMMDGAGEPTFYKHYFESGGLNQGIYMIAQEGARNHGLLNVGLSDFFDLDIVAPPLEEQRQLAGIFELQDRQLEVAKQHHTVMRQQKQALMQQLLTGQVRVSVAHHTLDHHAELQVVQQAIIPPAKI